MLNFDSESAVLDKFQALEISLLKINKELPEQWFLYKQIVSNLELIKNNIQVQTVKLKNSQVGELERLVSDRFQEVLKKIEKHNFLLDTYINKIKYNKIEPELTNNLKESMKLLIDDIHTLNLIALQYPIKKIAKKQILKEILTGLRKGLYTLPDINQETASQIIKKFINEELILAIQFNTNEKPYLMITSDGINIKQQIIKKKNIPQDIVISKIMGLLNLNNLIIDYKHKLIDNKVENLNKIEFIKGVNILQMPRLNDLKKLISFSFLLGAVSADAFALNLSDRPFNIYIDIDYFNKIYSKNILNYLGKNNPLFNLDYEFSTAKDSSDYLSSQIFGTNGLFVILFIEKADLVNAKLTIKEVEMAFNRGFLEELKLIIKNYTKNKDIIDYLLKKNNISYLTERFDQKNYEIIIKYEEELIPQLNLTEFKKTA